MIRTCRSTYNPSLVAGGVGGSFENDCPRAVYEFGQSRNNHYTNNLFFGHHPPSEPDDSARRTADPLFAGAPGTAGGGREAAIRVYTLRDGSPAISAGAVQPHHSSRDFAGHVIRTQDNRVDLGALAASKTR